MKGHIKSKTINRERTTATSPRSHSRSHSSGSGPCRICSSSPSEGNPFTRTLGSLFSLFLPVLSCLLASLLSVKRPWEKKRGRRQLRTNVGWGLSGYRFVKHNPLRSAGKLSYIMSNWSIQRYSSPKLLQHMTHARTPPVPPLIHLFLSPV